LIRSGLSRADLMAMPSTEGIALAEMLRWDASERLRRNREEVGGSAMPVVVIGEV